MKIIKLTIKLLMITFIINSCSKDDSLEELSTTNSTTADENDLLIKEYLFKNGLASENDDILITKEDVLAGDMVYSRAYLELQMSEQKSNEKQLAYFDPYRMNYGNAANILFYNGIPQSQPQWRAALVRAVNIWNDANLCLNVRISFINSNSPFIPKTNVVLANPGSFSNPTSVIADARRPENGRAGKRIRINFQTFNASNTTDEAMTNVLVHEIGHAIGFGHTRLSRNVVTTTHIPGTATGASGDFSSVMWASASTSTTTVKPFSNGDIIAARALYPSTTMNRQQYNLSGAIDQITPVDHNGDGQEGFAVYAPSAQRINFYDVQGNGFDFISNSNAGIAGFDLKSGKDRIVALDYDGDQDDDLCLYRPGNQVVYIARSNGNGSYTNIVASHGGLAGFDMKSNIDKVVSLDYNGDGKDDLCFIRPGSQVVYIGRSNGNGTFTNVVASHGGLAGFDMKSGLDQVVALDYNGDGKDDLCFYRPGSQVVYIGRSNGNGTFTNVVASHGGLAGFDMKSRLDKVVALDYNGDGKDDLCFYRPGSQVVYIARSNGNGTFTNIVASHGGLAGFDMKSTIDKVVAMDYDNDGDDDICFIRPGSQVIYIARSNGNGTFTNLVSSHVGVASNYTGNCIN